MATRALSLLLLAIVVAASFFSPSVAVTDTIGLTTSITGNQTLVSAGGVFTLGFFSPPGGRTYLGIWYTTIPGQTVVWVANRNAPIVSTPGSLQLTPAGRLVIVDRRNSTVWSSPAAATKNQVTTRATAQLRDNGNFLLSSDGSGAPDSVAWQSFDYPTDTLLPGMKLGTDLKRRLSWNITSWNSPTDPSPGAYTFKLVPGGLPEWFLFDGPNVIYASGPFNGARLTGVPNLSSQDFVFAVVSTPDATYYSYRVTDTTLLSRFVVDGVEQRLQRYVWNSNSGAWTSFWYYPTDPCDSYAKCGPYGYCDVSQPQLCTCLPGFQPRSQQQWDLRDATGGCVRTTNLSCPGAGAGDGFWPMNRMKLPQATNATVYADMTLDQCRQACLRNCSCRAYSAANMSGGVSRGCVIWAVDLLDIREYGEVVQDVFIRLAQSEVDALSAAAHRSPSRKVLIAGVASAAGVLLLLAIGCCCFWRNRSSRKLQTKTAPTSRNDDVLPLRARKPPLGPSRNQRLEEGQMGSDKDLDLPFLDLDVILDATDNFAEDCKIGQGGFGSVYMAKLDDGQEVAIKRLSKRSVQGIGEFKNEVKLIAKLQHRNLVRLLGCCIDGDERMLVYEFMHNNSLDTFIFDEGKRKSLEWKNRFDIILGIARGLLYLHEDSRVRIIHRDLKASNVLLDKNMIPKISDFGIARMFGGDQTTEHTMKVIGTYGYMSPEYAMDGVFSMKSDIYSFGVLVIEIITGKRNRGFYDDELDLNLLGYAWTLWKEGRGVDLLDEAMGGTFDYSVALRCIQVALLCVQVHPRSRPLMSSVVMMLSSENATMPEPNEPGVNIGRSTSDTDSSLTNTGTNFTGTAVDAR